MNALTKSIAKGAAAGLVVGLILAGVVDVISIFTSNKNELTNQNKSVVTPSVPIQPTEKLESRTSKIKDIQLLKLNPNRTLVINEQITFFSERLADQILEMGDSSEPIVILINSPGGNVFSGEKILSAMESVKSDIYTVCDGLCASMAAIIHQYGTKRLATDRSVLMFHDAAGGIQGRLSEMLSMLTMVKRKIEKANHYIANRSKISYDELVRLEANNYWIDSEDAMERGLVDGLVRLKNKPKPEGGVFGL